ncbi:zinc ribbon domain-containing protein [Candidatus Woesearchaeota archaeon]|nr:zinc ribbon domain-containing protein [Candidatus Woesearchaeota archaeon]
MLICQSCGMPMSRYEDKGTDSHKHKSEEYCKYCYEDGKFTDEGITMKDKIEKNVKMAVQRGMQEAYARKLAETTIPKLRRWNTQKF